MVLLCGVLLKDTLRQSFLFGCSSTCGKNAPVLNTDECEEFLNTSYKLLSSSEFKKGKRKSKISPELCY